LLSCEAVLFEKPVHWNSSLINNAILSREIQGVETEYGMVRVKVAWSGKRKRAIANVQPEYEDCAQLARQHNLSWREVYRLALHNWYLQHG